ncbi:MAG: 5'/3'-nucleotidase SurE [Ruminococcus sp.]|nr:5'/3'-nucleotidase SurE [Ruminococcus sp.]
MRKILITNDDGIEAGGLIRLARAAAKFGEVWVVAPDSQRSAMSHSINLHGSFDAWEADFPVEGVRAFACTGTPADCVRIGVLNIVPDKPDVVFSGINYGYNLATDLQYSATVGAAFEAAFQGIHTIAFSEHSDPCHEVTDRYLEEIIAELIDEPVGKNEIHNVNFPACPLSECKGILRDRIVSDGVFYQDHYDETHSANGRTTYTVVGVRRWEADEGTDLRAVLDNYISIGKAKNIT